MQDSTCIDTISTRSSRVGTIRWAIVTALAVFVAVWRILEEWRERGRQRHILAGLDPLILKDIGISEADAWAESTKPRWKR